MILLCGDLKNLANFNVEWCFYLFFVVKSCHVFKTEG